MSKKPLPILEMVHALATIFGGMGISARLNLAERRIIQIEHSLSLQRFILLALVGSNLGLLAWEFWN